MPICPNPFADSESEKSPSLHHGLRVLGALVVALTPWIVTFLPILLARAFGVLNAAGGIDADLFPTRFVGTWIRVSLVLMTVLGVLILYRACSGSTRQRAAAIVALTIYGFGVVMFLISMQAVWHPGLP